MIRRLTIHNFKIHKDTELDLPSLTILTGMNGMGKSSVFQIMLALRDSVMKGFYPEQLNLQGDSFLIGSAGSLVNWYVGEGEDPDKLKIGLISDGGEKLDFTFIYNSEQPSETFLKSKEGAQNPERTNLNNHPFFSKGRIQYLSAFRDGPQQIYVKNSSVVDDRREISEKLGKGEFAVYFLSRYGNEQVSDVSLLHDGPEDEAKTIKEQVNKWLHEISPDLTVKLESTDDSNYKLKYSYRREGMGNIDVDSYNTGYGITYILSVILALLASKKGDLILIENPEAHIHPSAQSALMRLISKAASSGIQLILETHSDHIVNGALVNFKKKVLSVSDLAIYFFDRENTSEPISINSLKIGGDSRIKKAPANFFSQMNRDLDVLFGE